MTPENNIDSLKNLIKQKESITLTDSVSGDKTQYQEPILERNSLEQIKTEHEKNKNQEEITSIQKDRKLKGKYAKRLFWLLLGEIVVIFLIVFLDGFKIFGFEINPWLLGMIFNVIMLQSFLLVRLVTKHLFK